LLTASSAVALASCGGEEPQVEQRTDTLPTIERTVAEGLASRSDKVASLLDAGDTCGAAEEAAALDRDFIETSNRGEIPALYLEDLGSAIKEIQAQIPPCEEPKDKDREKKDKDEGDD
jgi:hypothetical protein